MSSSDLRKLQWEVEYLGAKGSLKKLKPGEVIVQVSQSAVAKPEEVTARVDKLKAEGRRSVMLLVSGAENKMRFVSLRFEEPQ